MVAAARAESTPRPRPIARRLPGLVLALGLSGFWVYLGTLQLVGVEPRAAITGPYYILLGAGMAASAWCARAVLARRLCGPARLPRLAAGLGAALAGLFLLNAAVLSSGTLARDASILLVVSALPSALLVLALDRERLAAAAAGLVGLGIALALVEAATLAVRRDESARFSPIDELDPISAAQVTALAAVVLLAWRPTTSRRQWLRLCGFALLVAATVVPGSRGALLALLVGAIAVSLVAGRRAALLAAPALVAGLALGALGAAATGSDYYYGVGVPGLEERAAPGGKDFTGAELPEWLRRQEPISTFAIRRYLLDKSLRAIPDRPLQGHGIGSLVDDSPETMRLVRAGRVEPNVRTYPHNVLVESAYSLGAPGLALLLALVACAAVALARQLRKSAAPLALFALGLAAVAAVNSNVSGELGLDSYVWVALFLPVALYADTARAEMASSR